MKTISTFILTILLTGCALFTAQAQELASVPTNGYSEAKASKEEVSTTTAVNKEVTITLKNTSEKAVAVFAGHKEDIRDPKLKAVGGLSKNTLYVYTNDVVCLMSAEKKPLACTVVKPGVTAVEVNTSANGISSK